MGELAVTVIGHDRPGIIADVSEALARLALNLSDSTMTLLRGHFAMTLICTGEASASQVEQELAPLTAQGSLLVSVREVTPEVTPVGAGEPYVLSVHGADRLGIVAAVTRVIAEAGGNVTDLTTRLSDGFYVLLAQIDLPPGTDVAGLTARLEAVGRDLNVGVGLRPAEVDVF